MAKKRNAQDATLRNTRPLTRRVLALELYRQQDRAMLQALVKALVTRLGAR